MCKWTRISSYINTGYSIPAIPTCWGTKSHGQWGGLLLDSLSAHHQSLPSPPQELIGCENSCSVGQRHGKLLHKASNTFNTSHLTCRDESYIKNNFALYLLFFLIQMLILSVFRFSRFSRACGLSAKDWQDSAEAAAYSEGTTEHTSCWLHGEMPVLNLYILFVWSFWLICKRYTTASSKLENM